MSAMERVRQFTDEEIERIAAADHDVPPLTAEQLREAVAVSASGRRKRPISIRVDEEVLEGFRAGGARYQTRINEVLHAYHHGLLLDVPAEWREHFGAHDLASEVRRIVSEHVRRERHERGRPGGPGFVPAARARLGLRSTASSAPHWNTAARSDASS
ncbi:MAG TPA: BrnA antitoxin family protein [Longimicrobium sp.]|nr:BrnA antitoxin family protein [Longimicrobium sp.]